MWGWHDMGGWAWFWMSFVTMLWVAVLGFVVYIAVRLGTGKGENKRQ